MVDRLANVLQDLARSGELQNAVDLLHRLAKGGDNNSIETRGSEHHERTCVSSASLTNPYSSCGTNKH